MCVGGCQCGFVDADGYVDADQAIRLLVVVPGWSLGGAIGGWVAVMVMVSGCDGRGCDGGRGGGVALVVAVVDLSPLFFVAVRDTGLFNDAVLSPVPSATEGVLGRAPSHLI